jgi:hypothetical protein
LSGRILSVEALDNLRSIQQTFDGSYILGGYSQSNISSDKTENCIGGDDYWVVKTDSAGNIQWQNTIGGSGDDLLDDIRQTADGGYILGGYSFSDISGDKTENCQGDHDYWIVKSDSLGNIQWQNTIGGNENDWLMSATQTTDGGYILGGSSRSNISGDKTKNNWDTALVSYDYWIVKTDPAGNIQWQNTIGGTGNDDLRSIQKTADGGYVFGGPSASNISGNKTENCIGSVDYWIVKTDSTGNIEWQNTLGGSDADWLFSIQQTADEGYILGGSSKSNISGDKTENCLGGQFFGDYWIVKTDSAGNIQWQNTIGGSDDDFLYSIRQTADGGYILGGYSRSNISGDKAENSNGSMDYWVVKTDSAGNIQWQNTIGGSDWDQLQSIEQTPDGRYIFGGYSFSNISGDKTENSAGGMDYWVVKLFPDTITGIPDFQSSINNLQFSPNPLTTQSKLTFKNPNKEKFLFTLYDITGRITENISTITNEIILTEGSKQPGVYIYNLVNEKAGERMNGKVVVQ